MELTIEEKAKAYDEAVKKITYFKRIIGTTQNIIVMSKEDNKKRALEYLNDSKMYHTETEYGPDCQVYKESMYVVDIKTAQLAIEIALGNF